MRSLGSIDQMTVHLLSKDPVILVSFQASQNLDTNSRAGYVAYPIALLRSVDQGTALPAGTARRVHRVVFRMDHPTIMVHAHIWHDMVWKRA
jgi:hypothetical protein